MQHRRIKYSVAAAAALNQFIAHVQNMTALRGSLHGTAWTHLVEKRRKIAVAN